MVKSRRNALLTIINDILDFSKIEAGKLDLQLVDFDLPALLEQMMKIFSLSAGQKGLELVCESPTSADMVVGDPARLRQVLTNLVGNAVKFTAGGEIVVECPGRKPGGRGHGRLHFSVSDTGIGIPSREAAADL